MLWNLLICSLIISNVLSVNNGPKSLNNKKQNAYSYITKTTFIIDFLQKELEREAEKEIEEDMRKERERQRILVKQKEIYVKFLVSRAMGSSVLRDFFTLRY